MALSREIRQEFVKLLEIDGAKREDAAVQLGIGVATANRWPKEPWYEGMARTVRLARDEAIAEAARESAKETAANLVDTQTEWDRLRRGYIHRVRATVENTVVALEKLSEEIKDPNRYEDMRDYKSAVEAHGKLTEVARRLLMVEHEEKMAIATAQAAAQQRLTPEELACLTTDQLASLVEHGLEQLKLADGKVVEMDGAG